VQVAFRRGRSKYKLFAFGIFERMNTIRIMPVTMADARSIWSLVCLLEEQTFDYDLLEQLLAQNLQQPNNIYLLAADEAGRPYGYISCHGQLLLHHMGMVYEIQELVVIPEARGLGIGRQLIEALEERLSARTCISLEVTSGKRRTDAHRFYLSCGFKASHEKFTKQVTDYK
jgi:PhnO protein